MTEIERKGDGSLVSKKRNFVEWLGDVMGTIGIRVDDRLSVQAITVGGRRVVGYVSEVRHMAGKVVLTDAEESKKYVARGSRVASLDSYL